MEFFKTRKSHLAAVLIFLALVLSAFRVYYVRVLDRDINNHILNGEIFGVPSDLAARGIKPMYHGTATGWDGQFYYYMANDVFAQKDTAAHIDAPAYRYQRIGFAAFAKSVSVVLGQDWVSPKFHFVLYLLLISAAFLLGAEIFKRNGVSPYYMLFWGLSVGIQLCFFNALADAAADSFFIIATFLLLYYGVWASIVPLTLAILTRESYAVFVFGFYLFIFIEELKKKEWKILDTGFWANTLRRALTEASPLLIPLAAFVGWQFYLRQHFGVSPASGALGVLGAPMVAWYQYFVGGLQGDHPLLHQSPYGYVESVTLLLFLLCLVFYFISAAGYLKSHFFADRIVTALSVGGVLLVLMYLCFGPTVIMHYTGYFKTVQMFFFLLPLLFPFMTKRWKISLIALIIVSLAVTNAYNLVSRIFV